MIRADLLGLVATLAGLRAIAEAERAAAHDACLTAGGGPGSLELEELAADADTIAANLTRAWELARSTVQQLDHGARRIAGIQNVVAVALADRDAAAAAKAAAEQLAATRLAEIDRLEAELAKGRAP